MTVHPFFGGVTAFLTCGGNSMGIVLAPILVLAITSSKIVQFAWDWASLPCPSKAEHKKHHFTTVHPFFGEDTAFLTCGGNSMGIVQAPIVVLAITSSKIVQFAGDWASLPCPSIAEHKKYHFTTVHPFFGEDTAFLTCGGNSMGIVQEQIMVLAITSSKIVQFAGD
jgi:predicted metal-binding protein